MLAGHDENEATASAGRPIERMLNMAEDMLQVVQKFKMPSTSTLRVRIGELGPPGLLYSWVCAEHAQNAQLHALHCMFC